MDNQTLQRLKDLISKSESIAIAVGNSPTVDEMAAALSLYLSLDAINKKASIVSRSEPLVEHSSLVGIDRVTTKVSSGSGDLVVSFPYREGEIEKVSYTIDNGLLNIVVKAGEQGLSFQERDVQFTRGTGIVNLVFVVGTPRFADIEGMFDKEALANASIVNIDNKDHNEGYGDIVLVSSKFSSVSEQAADLLLSLGLEPDVDIAQNLFIGISESTNNFQDPRTSYLAFELAGLLMKRGARRIPAAGAAMPAPRPEERKAPSTYGQQAEQPRSYAEPVPTQPSAPVQPQPQYRPEPAAAAPRPQSPLSQPQPADDPYADDQNNPPPDWLTPKVYKGSTNI